MKFVITGHIDHGKSSLIGRLLLETESLPTEKLKEIKKCSQSHNKELELAYVVDQLKEEREKNLTIDTAEIFFKWQNKTYSIIDTPGHLNLIKNMLTGASQADAGILVVSAKEGVEEETRRHAFLLKFLGIEKIIVIINKMDLVNYCSQKFNKIKNELIEFFKKLEITPFYFVPVSARTGENILKKSKNLNWYQGPIFLKTLEVLHGKIKNKKQPLRLPIQDIYKIKGENIAVGRICSGKIKKGQKIIIMPNMKETTIKKIKYSYNKNKFYAITGENVGLVFSDDIYLKRGQIIVDKENPLPLIPKIFKSSIFWLAEKPLITDEPLIIKCSTQQVLVIAEKIEKRINSSTLKIIEENCSSLNLNETGVVIFKSLEPLIVEKFSEIPELGRFLIMNQKQQVIGAGTIQKIEN